MKGAKWRALFCFIVALAAGCFAAACAEEHVHEYEAVVTPPTCTEQGYTTYTCPEDGESYVGDYVEPLGHTPAEAVKENVVDATCLGGGSYDLTIYCSVCGEELSRESVEVEKKDHTPETVPGKEATCTQAGLTEGSKCSVCGTVLKEQEEIPAKGHTPTEAKKENEKTATCTEAGSYDEVVYCSVCKEEISRKHVQTAALGHAWGSGAVTTAPTCSATGVRTYTCSRCDAKRTENIPMTAHTPVTVPGKAATCFAPGLTEGSKCSVCGTVLKAQEVISASGHSWTENAEENYLVSAATCEEKAVYYKSCSVCGAKGTETFEFGELAAHTSETIPGKAATCTETGLTEGSKCSVCGTVLKEQEEIPAKGHTPSEAKKENEKTATCTEAGSYDEVVYCSVCKEEISRKHVQTAALGHAWGSGAVTTAPTCSATGVRTYTCSRCDAKRTENIPMTAHTPVTVPGKAATCTETGLTDGEKCSVCGTVLKAQEEIPASGHSWTESAEAEYLVSAATCTAQAVYYKSCSACGTKSEETFAYGELASHTPVIVPGKAATCTEAGLTEGSKCSVCGTVLKEQEEIPAKGHTPSEAKKENEKTATCTEAGSYDEVVYCTVCDEELSRKQVTVEKLPHTLGTAVRENEIAATCTTEGSYEEVVYCTVCDEELSREQATVEKLPHTPEVVPGKAATCTETGLTDGERCSVCGAVLKAQKEIPASGHSWGEWTQTKAPTCTTAGEEQRVCNNDPTHVETRVISASAHTWVESAEAEYLVSAATCEKRAVYYKSCSVCGAKGTETFEFGELAGHMSETIPGKAATCTETGLTDGEKCSVCGAVLKAQKEIPALDHSFTNYISNNDATCTQDGTETANCDRCEETNTRTAEGSAKGHDYTNVTPVWTWTLYTEATAAFTCTRDGCGHEEKISAGISDEVTTDATCTTEGVRTYTAQVTLNGQNYTDIKTETISALAHDFVGNICTVCGGIDMSMPEKGSGSTVAVHDPSVIIAYADSYGIVYPTKEDGRSLTKVYFVFGTELAAAYSFDMESWVAFTPTFYEEGTTTVSADYYKVFRTVADWSGYNTSATVLGNTWAPDIIYNPELEKWCVYYSLSGDGNDHKQSSVYLMTSSSITGPYEYAGSVVYSGMTNKTSGAGNADYQKVTGDATIPDRYLTGKAWSNNYGVHCIDPAVMYDEAGELWLFYGSWSGGIALIKLDNETGLRDLDYNYGYTESDFADDGAVWEGTSLVYDPYMGIHIAGGWWVSGEGPYVEYIDGYYYLFMSYGGYAPDGGYNMRVFRSESITGKYLDPDGTWAVYGESNGNNYGADVTHGLSFMQNYKWSWWTGPASLSQGHNSAVVDEDGNAYLVYHIKYDDGTIQHNVEVHRLVKAAEGADSWYLVAPFQKSGYDRILEGATQQLVAGNWNVLIHRPIANYMGMQYNTDVVVTLNEDGTVSGVYTGKWSVSGQYITITLEGEGTFSGVLMEQQIEGIDGKQLTYTFTAMNEGGLCVWGARFTDELAAELMADRITFPDTILGDLGFETQGLWGTTITYSSSNPAVLSNDGTFTAPAEDTNLTLTVTVSIGSASISQTKTFIIKGLSEDSIKQMLPNSIADDGYLVKAEPGAGGSIAPIGELSNYTGVSFTFRVKDVKTDWDVMFRTANGTQVYLSVLNYKNVNIFEAEAALSEAGKQFLIDNSYAVTGFNHVIFLNEVKANQENGSVATISYNVDGSIAFYRNGVLMLTYAAETPISVDENTAPVGTVSDLVNTMVAQVRTQGLSVVYPVSNVIIGYAADYDKDNVPTRVPIETLGTDNGDDTYTLGFNTWEPSLIKEVTGDFKVVYDFNVKAPSLYWKSDEDRKLYENWNVKIGDDWVLRADYFSGDLSQAGFPAMPGVVHSEYINWTDYCNYYRDADVILTIERTGEKVVVTAEIAAYNYTYTATYASFGTQDTTVSLGGENCLISVYGVTAESGEDPVEPEFPMVYPAMPDVAETGLSVSFTLANAVYQSGSPDSTWNALLSAGGYVITFGNLDAYSTTGALTGMNLYPSNSQFGGANWDGLFGQGTIKVTIDITKDSIVFYRNGMPIIQYVREGGSQAEIDFVGPFIDAFLAEVAENGFTFAEVAYDITNVEVGPAQKIEQNNDNGRVVEAVENALETGISISATISGHSGDWATHVIATASKMYVTLPNLDPYNNISNEFPTGFNASPAVANAFVGEGATWDYFLNKEGIFLTVTVDVEQGVKFYDKGVLIIWYRPDYVMSGTTTVADFAEFVLGEIESSGFTFMEGAVANSVTTNFQMDEALTDEEVLALYQQQAGITE